MLAKRQIHTGQAVTLSDVVVGANYVPTYALVAASVPATDPLAGVRAQAKLFLDIGTDPRVVLGVLDELTIGIAGDSLSVDRYRKTVAELVVSRSGVSGTGRCAHGHSLLPGACTDCALVLARPDAAPIESGKNGAWEREDCEG